MYPNDAESWFAILSHYYAPQNSPRTPIPGPFSLSSVVIPPIITLPSPFIIPPPRIPVPVLSSIISSISSTISSSLSSSISSSVPSSTYSPRIVIQPPPMVEPKTEDNKIKIEEEVSPEKPKIEEAAPPPQPSPLPPPSPPPTPSPLPPIHLHLHLYLNLNLSLLFLGFHHLGLLLTGIKWSNILFFFTYFFHLFFFLRDMHSQLLVRTCLVG
jgi:hypothetical protein